MDMLAHLAGMLDLGTEYLGEIYLDLGGAWIIYGPPDNPFLGYSFYVMWAC